MESRGTRLSKNRHKTRLYQNYGSVLGSRLYPLCFAKTVMKTQVPSIMLFLVRHIHNNVSARHNINKQRSSNPTFEQAISGRLYSLLGAFVALHQGALDVVNGK